MSQFIAFLRMETCCLALWLLGIGGAAGQPDTVNHSVYRVTKKYELSGSVLFIGASYLGFRKLDQFSAYTAEDVNRLSTRQVNAFDRPVFANDPAGFDRAQVRSDNFLTAAILSPLLLMADRRMRKDWLDLLTLYAVTHAADNLVYFASAYSVRRARPLAYYPTLPLEARTGQAKSNSFYSGHVAFSSTSTFFLVKVFTDYHGINGWKRIAAYSVASVPPALVGLNRIKAGKHFRTDVVLGFVVGAAAGILIPEWHRTAKASRRVTLDPYITPSGQSGLTFTTKF